MSIEQNRAERLRTVKAIRTVESSLRQGADALARAASELDGGGSPHVVVRHIHMCHTIVSSAGEAFEQIAATLNLRPPETPRPAPHAELEALCAKLQNQVVTLEAECAQRVTELETLRLDHAAELARLASELERAEAAAAVVRPDDDE